MNTLPGFEEAHFRAVQNGGSTVEFRVRGEPRPEGSLVYKGKARSKRTGREFAVLQPDNAKDLALWRGLITDVAAKAWAGRPPILAPVAVRMVFTFMRTKGHYGSGRNALRLMPSAPREYNQRPDLSKLARAVEDAITDAGVWRDDAQVVRYDELAKAWSEEYSGVWVHIRELL